jgi:hypothetical protein
LLEFIRLVSGSDDFTLFLWTPTEDKKPLCRMTGESRRGGSDRIPSGLAMTDYRLLFHRMSSDPVFLSYFILLFKTLFLYHYSSCSFSTSFYFFLLLIFFLPSLHVHIIKGTSKLLITLLSHQMHDS